MQERRQILAFDDDCLEPSASSSSKAESGFILRVESFNGTAWSAIKHRMLQSPASIFFAQETHLGPEATDAASEYLKRRGWNSLWTPAFPGANATSWKGGAFIAVSTERVGISLASPNCSTVVPGRIVAAKIEAPGYPPFLGSSIYLRLDIGAAGEHLDHLASLGKFACEASHPVLFGGDFQLGPGYLSETAFAEALSAIVLKPRARRGTCKGVSGSIGNCIDMYC